MRITLPALLLVGLVGCDGGFARSLDPVPSRRAASLERTDDGKLVVHVRDGELVGLEGKRLDLPPGRATFLVFFDAEGAPERQGEDPMGAAVWLRGRGDRRHTLPSVISPFVGVGNSDDWTVGLKAGIYDLSLQLVGIEAEPSEAVVVVR